MNPPNPNTISAQSAAGSGEAEQTLRLMANLPAPEGMEDRVKAALRNAPQAGRVLPWSTPARAYSNWLHSQPVRGAAAAAIVCVVVGGAWAVYSHIEPASVDRMTVMPRVAAPGGFSAAGAMRTPQTLNGPVLTHPRTVVEKSAAAAEDNAGASTEKKSTTAKDKSRAADKSSKEQRPAKPAAH